MTTFWLTYQDISFVGDGGSDLIPNIAVLGGTLEVIPSDHHHYHHH